MRTTSFSAGLRAARLPLAIATLFSASVMAHADSMSTYTVSGSSAANSRLSGTVTIDNTTGAIEDVNLTAGSEDLTTIEDLTYSNGTYSGLLGPQAPLDASFLLTNGDLSLAANTGLYEGTVTLETPAASSTTSSSSSSTGAAATAAQTAAVTAAPTPEPCSFLLLLTGLGGITVLARKKAARRRGREAKTAAGTKTLATRLYTTRFGTVASGPLA